MSNPFWDQKFSGEDYLLGKHANAFLVAHRHLFSPTQKVLAVADGEGRNGVWMAEQGLDVLSVDGSARGLEKARQLAAERGVSLGTELADLLEWTWPQVAFDWAVLISCHFSAPERQRVHRAMQRSLKPGGGLIVEVFHKDQLKYATGGPPSEDMLYTADMLRQDFTGLEIELLEEKVIMREKGSRFEGQAAVVRLLGRRR